MDAFVAATVNCRNINLVCTRAEMNHRSQSKTRTRRLTLRIILQSFDCGLLELIVAVKAELYSLAMNQDSCVVLISLNKL